LIGRLAGGDHQHFGQARPRCGIACPSLLRIIAIRRRQTSLKLSPACHASERGLILPRRCCSRPYAHREAVPHRPRPLLAAECAGDVPRAVAPSPQACSHPLVDAPWEAARCARPRCAGGMRDRVVRMLFAYHSMNACRHRPNLSVAALARFRATTQHDAPAPGYRDGVVVAQRHTTASHQPGLACGSCLPGMLASAWGRCEAVPVAPPATASHAVRGLCLGDGTPCTESFTLQLPSDLAAGSSMCCSSNLRWQQSNYSGTVPPVASSMVHWTMHPAPVFAGHAQLAPAVMASNLIPSPCPCARYGAKLSSWGRSRRSMARLPSMNFLLWPLPARREANPPSQPAPRRIMAP
jgi:hypothetical protein